MGKKGVIEQESPMNVVYRKKDQLQFQNKERNGEHIHPLGVFPLKWFFLAQSYDFAQLLHTVIRGWGFATVLLVMFNKAALSSYEFPCANVITVMQVGGGCSSGAAKKGFTSIGTQKGLMQSPFSLEFLNHSKFQNATTGSLVSKVTTKDDFSWLQHRRSHHMIWDLGLKVIITS
jgi:hypothetical protein